MPVIFKGPLSIPLRARVVPELKYSGLIDIAGSRPLYDDVEIIGNEHPLNYHHFVIMLLMSKRWQEFLDYKWAHQFDKLFKEATDFITFNRLLISDENESSDVKSF